MKKEYKNKYNDETVNGKKIQLKKDLFCIQWCDTRVNKP